MRDSKKKAMILCLSLLLLLGGGIVGWRYLSPSAAELYHMEVIGTEDNGYGYKIYKGSRVVILQPFIPVVSGKRAFQTKQEARCVGNLVLKRISEGDDFTISGEDLNNLKITY